MWREKTKENVRDFIEVHHYLNDETLIAVWNDTAGVTEEDLPQFVALMKEIRNK